MKGCGSDTPPRIKGSSIKEIVGKFKKEKELVSMHPISSSLHVLKNHKYHLKLIPFATNAYIDHGHLPICISSFHS